MSIFLSIFSIILLGIEIKQIYTLNEIFRKIWKRFGSGTILKKKFKDDFNKAIKNIFMKNIDKI